MHSDNINVCGAKSNSGLAWGSKSHRPNPDFDGNGNLNVNDFMAYLNAFAAQEKRADINGDGKLTAADFRAYSELYERTQKHMQPPPYCPVMPNYDLAKNEPDPTKEDAGPGKSD